MKTKKVFRVQKNIASLAKRKINQNQSRTCDRLSMPKDEYVPQDPFNYFDFRGLLNADFKDALVNRFD